MSEKIPTSESQESRVERVIAELAKREGMEAEDILSDIVTFSPHEENESHNPFYLEELAEKLNISIEEINQFAVEKFEEQ
jgi:beta-N-acetylglucosaminidase